MLTNSGITCWLRREALDGAPLELLGAKRPLARRGCVSAGWGTGELLLSAAVNLALALGETAGLLRYVFLDILKQISGL